MLKHPLAAEIAESNGHRECDDDPCVACLAQRNLLPEDWDAVRFYERVADQVVCLNPMGDKDGQLHFTPRLEGWLAVLRAYQYPESSYRTLISRARYLFQVIHSEHRTPGLLQMDPEELRGMDG